MGATTFEYYKDKEKTEKNRRGKGSSPSATSATSTRTATCSSRDRKTDMIISGGVNIYPAEIESVLLTHPKVADAAVFGIPHEDWGEEVKAVVEPVEGIEAASAGRRAILDFCRDKLAKYKRPKSIDFTTEMPRDPNGKLYKRKPRPSWGEGRPAISEDPARTLRHPPWSPRARAADPARPASSCGPPLSARGARDRTGPWDPRRRCTRSVRLAPVHGPSTTSSLVKIHPRSASRVGNSADSFYFGPEVPGAVPRPRGGFKDRDRRDRTPGGASACTATTGAAVVREVTAADADISWTVSVANTQAAWYRFGVPLDLPIAATLSGRNGFRRVPSARGSWSRPVRARSRGRGARSPSAAARSSVSRSTSASSWSTAAAAGGGAPIGGGGVTRRDAAAHVLRQRRLGRRHV